MSRSGPTLEERKASLVEALWFLEGEGKWELFLKKLDARQAHEIIHWGRKDAKPQELRLLASQQRLWLILKLYYGLTNEGVFTTQEIAERFKVSVTHINQMRNKALKKLRHPTFSRGLRD